MKFNDFIVDKKYCFLFLLLGFLGHTFAQDRGAKVTTQNSDIVPLPAVALLIANSNYEDESYPDLIQPKVDVNKLKKIICERYQFVDSNVLVLYDAVTDTLIKYFRKLGTHTGDVFIFYAGHGNKYKYGKDGTKESSHIIPVDFKPGTDASLFLTYDKIKSNFFEEDGNTNYKHFLFISDACFSGLGIDQMRSSSEYEEKEEKEVYELYSKNAAVGIGSTLNAETPDISIFTAKFCEILSTHTKNYWLSSKEIYNEIYLDFASDKSKTNSQKPMRKQSTETSDFFFFLKPEFSNPKKEDNNSNQLSAAGVDKKTENIEKKVQSYFELNTPAKNSGSKEKVLELRRKIKTQISSRSTLWGNTLQWTDEDVSTLKLKFELIGTKKDNSIFKGEVKLVCYGMYNSKVLQETITILIPNDGQVDFETMITNDTTVDKIRINMLNFATNLIDPN